MIKIIISVIQTQPLKRKRKREDNKEKWLDYSSVITLSPRKHDSSFFYGHIIISLSSQPSLNQKNNIYIYIYINIYIYIYILKKKDIVDDYLLILYSPNKIRKRHECFYLESY